MHFDDFKLDGNVFLEDIFSVFMNFNFENTSFDMNKVTTQSLK
jgi:hypothetical protein